MVNTQMETMETWDKGHGQKYRRSTANFSQCLQVIITIIQLIRSSTFLACAVSLQKWLRDKEIEQGSTLLYEIKDHVLITSSIYVCRNTTPLDWIAVTKRKLRAFS